MLLSVGDFENLFRPAVDQEYHDLAEKIIGAWARNWKDYMGYRGDVAIRVGYHYSSGEELTKFLEWMLEKVGDGYRTDELILIFLTSRVRRKIREELRNDSDTSHDHVYLREKGYLGLYWLIEEWLSQENSTREYDSLTAALIRQNYHSKHICWALSGHARRMRVGIGRKGISGDDKAKTEGAKLQISQRLVEAAKSSLKHGGGPIDQFCYMPSEYFGIYLHGQEMLNHSRRGDQRTASDLASEQRKKLNGVPKEEQRSFWCLHLEWFAWYVSFRAASALLDVDLHKEARDGLKSVEDKCQIDSTKRYFKEALRGRLLLNTEGEGRGTGNSDWPSHVTLFRAVTNWRGFYGDGGDDAPDQREIEMTTKSRTGIFDRPERSEQYKKFCGVKGVEAVGFQKIHQIAHGSRRAFRRQFQPFVMANPKEGKERALRMMKEIDEARVATTTNPSQLSCTLLEILHRELVYRLWFEVAKMPMKRGRPEHEVDVVYAIDILKRIKGDISRLRRHPCPAIVDSISVLENLRTEDGAKAFSRELREHLKENVNFETIHADGEGGQSYFLGLPYAKEGQNTTEIMHAFVPLMASPHPTSS